MAVQNGVHTNQSICLGPWPVTATIYELWVNDSYSNGLGENTYKTASKFTTTYYKPLQPATPEIIDDPHSFLIVVIF